MHDTPHDPIDAAPESSADALREWVKPQVTRIRADEAKGNAGAGFDFASEAS